LKLYRINLHHNEMKELIHLFEKESY
jgi:hypothetical protein